MIEKYTGPLSLVFLVFGGLMFVIGNIFDIPAATNLGVIFLGLLSAAQGAQMIAAQSNESSSDPQKRQQVMKGRIWGGIFFALGGVILMVGLANFFLPGGMQGYMDRLLSRPQGWGLILSLAGAFSLAYGTTALLELNSHKGGGFSATLEKLRQGLAGLFFVISGTGLGLVGLGLLLMPGIMASIGELLKQIFENWLMG